MAVDMRYGASVLAAGPVEFSAPQGAGSAGICPAVAEGRRRGIFPARKGGLPPGIVLRARRLRVPGE